uniref:Uncharacterized protein n=1 Tax=Arundo donax TaxID=35708 RepID=A0A0A9CJK3_ARUDO
MPKKTMKDHYMKYQCVIGHNAP